MVQMISKEELKAKMDRGDEFKLVMTMNQWHYEAEHIPGSILVSDKESAKRLLQPEDEIVCYCSDRACSASRFVADLLERAGYGHVLHYDGELNEWKKASYPTEGTLVEST